MIGILSGISYVSGLDYYKGINEQYAKLVGKRLLMPPNPRMLLSSVDCDVYAKMLTEGNWEGVYKHLAAGVEPLVKGGAAFLCIASNTGHMCVPMVRELYPDLPVLHIADCTAVAIKKAGLSTVGLLGTEPTMREAYLIEQLQKHGITVLVPDSEEAMAQIFQYIMDELGFNVFKDSTREYFVGQVRALAARGAQGVICGCTEIELLIQQEHVPEVPLFPSAELHIAAAAQVQAGKVKIEAFQPAKASA